MVLWIGIIIFVYGLIFGSFYNVIIYRLPLDISIAKGRSMCPACKTTLRAKDLLPIFSWLFLKGKCRYCGAKIPARYPLIELATGLLFVMAYLQFGLGVEFILYCSFYSMLLITAMIDLDHMIICDYVLYGFSFLSLICMFLLKVSWKDHFMGFAIGFGFYLLIYLAAKAVYKKEAFGFGDVMLMGAIGLILGFWDTIIAAMLSFYIAIFFIIILKLLGKKLKLRQEIPFGPYMCMAALVTVLYGDAIRELYFKLISL